MTLSELLASVRPYDVAVVGADLQVGPSVNPSVEVLGLTDDSRQVKPGWVFVAVPGTREDGTRYAAGALRAGAVAVVAERAPEDVQGAEAARVVVVSNARAAAARLACRFYGDPSGSLRLIGVTGTNGKTTVTYLLEQIFAAAGANVGVLGTVAYRYGGRSEPAGQTTPLPISLQALLARMRDAGVDTVAMEVSSHALALDRVLGCRFDVAVFTNLTQDHLDFHGTLDDYFGAKRKLFEMLDPDSRKPYPSAAVVNADDPRAAALAAACRVPVMLYGFSPPAAVLASDVEVDLATGTSFTLDTPAGRAPVRLALLGRHNVANALAAAAAALTQRIPLDLIVRGLESTAAVPGRLERVDRLPAGGAGCLAGHGAAGRPVAVLVDYAHTPDALENVLSAARAMGPKKLLVVFGCGGDRDRTKRPIMGRIAVERADWAVLTSDNPRTEDPERIVREVEAGIRPTGRSNYQVIVDRREAIAAALGRAKPGDCVIIAGKGHETYQIFRDRTIHFDDREIAREVLGR